MITNFIGQCIIVLFKSAKYIFSGRIHIKNTIIQASIIGFDSTAIAVVITLISGSVLALQVAKQFVLSGAEAYVGGLVSIAMIREMAPVFASLAIGARAGTAIAAELGNMKVTEQIDALQVLKVDPIAHLVVPRLIAGVLMVPLITILSQAVGILGGMFVAKSMVNIHPNIYINSVWLYLGIYDIKVSIVKAAVFGLLITLICCTHGLATKGGAKEVGIATTRAAVWSALSILVFDYFLTWIFYG